MKFHRVTGGGGTHLNVVESGNPKGCPILYIHGISQCWLQWSRQINSDLAEDHRLVAMDMRGHGLSDKPVAGYEDSKMWADDVNAVIETLELDNPVLCGWSYGPLVILDYIRHYGEDQLGCLQFIGAITKLGWAVRRPRRCSLPNFSTSSRSYFQPTPKSLFVVSGGPAPTMFQPKALAFRDVPDAGIQRLGPAVRPAGTVLAVLS